MPAPDFSGELERLAHADLLRRRRRVDSPVGPRLTAEGREYLAFASNDYLGLASDARLTEAAIDAVRRYGVGAGASHLVSGHHALHEALERRLARFMGQPCLAFGSGYAANIGAIPALVGREDAIFADRLIHASLIDGCQLARADLRRFRHSDTAHLAQLLAQTRARRKLIVVDGVFSMDGDIAPLPELLALAHAHDAWLYVDDAHGFGVLGARGRGVLEHYAMDGEIDARIILMSTLGKAAGACGAALFARADLVEWVLQSARSYVFSTATPPLIAAALAAGVDVIEQESWRRERLRELIAALREGCAALPWTLLPSDTPIQPLIVGENAAALELAERLRGLGIWVPAIRPPTVPQGTARLRISLCAAHTTADVAQLADALAQAARSGLGR